MQPDDLENQRELNSTTSNFERELDARMNDVEGEIDFEINFDDRTILEGNGEYERCKKIIARGDKVHGKRIPGPDEWMLKSSMTIESVYGVAQFVLHFYSDRRVIIDDYASSGGDVLYNPDIQALSQWTQSKGWNAPEPKQALVKSNLDFWKHFWASNAVDSAYLESVFGIRPQDLPPDPTDELQKE